MIASLVLAATVIRLPMPKAATIDPFGARSLMAVARDGAIAATLTVRGYAKRIVLWPRSGGYRLLPQPGTIAAFDENDALLVNTTQPERISARFQSEPIDLSACERFPQLSMGPLVTGTLGNGALVATMQSPAIVDLDDRSGQRAPVVLYLRSGQCINLGNGIALATNGLYSAGYAAFIGSVPAPSNVWTAGERFVALRWRERARHALGAGIAIAVNALGAAVGADTLPGMAYGSTPHAMLWPSSGARIALDPRGPLSVAYAVDDRGRVTGMLEDARGRHYAFLWRDGNLRRLDDLVRAPGWRFECGYAFAPDGAIVGIGTYRGSPAGFEIQRL